MSHLYPSWGARESVLLAIQQMKALIDEERRHHRRNKALTILMLQEIITDLEQTAAQIDPPQLTRVEPPDYGRPWPELFPDNYYCTTHTGYCIAE